MQRVSHSQADAYNSCEKKFQYAHIENLQPKQTPHQLARGIYGHRVLQVFFDNIKAGHSNQDSAALALAEAIKDPVFYKEVGNQLFHFINVRFPTLGWRIVEVEKTFYLTTGTDSEYPFTVDLVIEYAGKYWIVDHKFSADSYDDEVMDVYPQLPKYIGALRALYNQGKFEYKIYSGIYNFIRTRGMKNVEEQVVQKPLKNLTTERIKLSFKAQLDTVERINNHQGEYLRTFSNNCKYCSFLDLCRVELSGDDSSNMKRVMYEPNAYGYDDIEEKI